MSFSLLVLVQYLFSVFMVLSSVSVNELLYLCPDIKNFETAKEKFVYVVEDEIYYNKPRREKTY